MIRILCALVWRHRIQYPPYQRHLPFTCACGRKAATRRPGDPL